MGLAPKKSSDLALPEVDGADGEVHPRIDMQGRKRGIQLIHGADDIDDDLRIGQRPFLFRDQHANALDVTLRPLAVGDDEFALVRFAREKLAQLRHDEDDIVSADVHIGNELAVHRLFAVDEPGPEAEIQERRQPEERHQVFFFLAELLIVARELIICEKDTLRAVHAVSLLSGSGDAQQLTNLRGMKSLAQTVHGFDNSLAPHVSFSFPLSPNHFALCGC